MIFGEKIFVNPFRNSFRLPNIIPHCHIQDVGRWEKNKNKNVNYSVLICHVRSVVAKIKMPRLKVSLMFLFFFCIFMIIFKEFTVIGLSIYHGAIGHRTSYGLIIVAQ